MLRQIFTGKRIAILAGAALLTIAAVAIVQYVLYQPPQPPAVQEPLPSTLQESLRDSDLGEVKQTLGPFETIAVSPDSPDPETSAPAVLLLRQDGSTQASKEWGIKLDGTPWAQTQVSKITSVSLEMDYATIGASQRVYVVKANQPFIFEDRPQQTYIVDSTGVIRSIQTARAFALRQSL